MASRIIDVDYYAGGDRKVVTSVDVYKSIRALQLEGVTSQRATAKILGISRNTVKNIGWATQFHGIESLPARSLCHNARSNELQEP